jgi:hypothetical protein
MKSDDRTNGYGFPVQEEVKLANGNAYQDFRKGTSHPPHQLRGGWDVHLHDPVTVKA